MREEENEADPEVQYIQGKKQENIRKAGLKHDYNNYEYCTFQQKLSKHNARRVKNTKKLILIIITMMIIKWYIVVACI